MIRTLLKIIMSGLLIWWLISQSDTDRLIENLTTADPWGMALAISMLACLSAVQALRWSLIIRAIGSAIRYKDALLIVLIGIFFNQTLPSSIGGDAIRMWRAYRLGLGAVPAVHSVALDRLAALLALVLVAAVGTPLVFSRLGDHPERWGVPVLVVGGLAAFAILFVFDRIPGGFMNWRPLKAISGLSADARRVLLRPITAVPVLAISMGMHSVAALVVYIIARAMALPVEVLDCLILVPPVVLFSILPISIAGWGVREGAMVTAFAFVGIGYDEAFALSVLFGLVIMVTGIPGGVLWLILGSKRTEDRAGAETVMDALQHEEKAQQDGVP
jgi:glycosyltransferase 2 family protein